MIYNTKSTKYLFDHLKNGDFLGFFKKKWKYIFARLIFIVTGNKLSHVGMVFDVERSDHILTFKFGEQTVSEGKIVNTYSSIKVIKNDKENYDIDSRFKDKHCDLYILSNEHTISKAQNKMLSDYWHTYEEYSIKEILLTKNWIYKLFGDKNKIYDGGCSLACQEAARLIGIVETKFPDPVPDPTEFAKSSYIKNITKIKCV